MNGTSKCGNCVYKEECDIRNNLNKIIREAIKNAESHVKQLSTKEIDYMIVTDISVIPVRCDRFQCKDGTLEKAGVRKEEGLFCLGRRLAPTAI